MAEGGVNPELSKEDDLLYCSVCMEEYEDPRALPCLHTFCYKCLVQLSMKEGAGASEKQLASYVGNLLNFLDKQNMLKCPLCSEEHPIPKDRGVEGFRRDFRINQLIQQQRSKNSEVVQKDPEPKDTPDTDVEKCRDHPGEKLLYHCENAACKCDICQSCWAECHDKHNVTLLSKKVKDARDTLNNEISCIVTEISSQIDLVSEADKSVIEQYAVVEAALKQRFADIQKKLKEAFDGSFAQLESQKKSQEKKMADKLESLRVLRGTCEAIQDDLQINVRARTSATVDEYELLYEQMKQLSADLSQWNLFYNTALLTESKLGNFINDAALVTYQKAHLGKEPETESKDVLAKSKGKVTEATDNKTPTEKSPRQSMQGQEDKQKDLSANQNSSQIRKVPIKLKLETSFKTENEVKSLAVFKNGDLCVATTKHISHYETSSVTKIFEKEMVLNADATTTVASNSDNIQFVVQLNTIGRTLSFSCLDKNSTYFHSVEKNTMGHLSSSDNLLSYIYKEYNKLHVRCLSVDDSSPKISRFGTCAQIHFDSGKIGSMCLYKSNKGNPIVFCANMFVPGKSKKSETALLTVALTKQVVYSRITFKELDPNASNFNLCSIVSDSDNIFALNNVENVIYIVLKIGKTVQKVSVEGVSFPFSSARRICLEAKSKSLYVASDEDMISKFRYQ